MLQALKRLQGFHKKSIIHKDIQPANIALARRATFYISLTMGLVRHIQIFNTVIWKVTQDVRVLYITGINSWAGQIWTADS
jgi:tRNA A-37 threonylcarbamoyl transferase component Bud32